MVEGIALPPPLGLESRLMASALARLRASSYVDKIGLALVALLLFWLVVNFVREPVEFINGLIGLTNGAIYGVVALGYTLVYGILQLINFAHGDVFALSGSSRARSSFRCSGSTPTRACRSSSVGSSSRSSW